MQTDGVNDADAISLRQATLPGMYAMGNIQSRLLTQVSEDNCW